MNTYRYRFASNCPENGEAILYSLEIQKAERILVEHIKTACALHRRGYHEDIAADLQARFGGDTRLIANHHGVEIESHLTASKTDGARMDRAGRGNHKTGRDLYYEHVMAPGHAPAEPWCELPDDEQTAWNAKAKEKA